MDSDTTEDSSSDYSTDSSDEDGMETADICGTMLQLPQGLCENKEIFFSIMSGHMWNSLSEDHREHLLTFLPNFPENDDEEKNRTLQKLFDCDTFRFESPLERFHEDLKAGYFRSDIASMRRVIKKAQKKETLYRYRKCREKLKEDVIESQRKLVTQINSLPPGIEPRAEKNVDPNLNYIVHRTKKRYFQVLTAIHSKVTEDAYGSPDENYPEGPPVTLSRKQRRHLNSIRNIYTNSELFTSTTATRAGGLDLEKYITPARNPFYVTDEAYKMLVLQHKRRKLNRFEDSEMNTKGLNMTDVVNRTQLPYIKNLMHRDNRVVKKVKREKVRLSPHSSTEAETDSDSLVEVKRKTSKKAAVKVKSEPVPPPKVVHTENKFQKEYTPVTVSDLEGIDMMEIPIDLENSDIDILELNKPELMQETHSNFLSLIRDIVCSTNEHRMSFSTLEQRLKTWQENPISPLNDWYSQSENWVGLLRSAVNFLCGNIPPEQQPDDFVPYMERKTPSDALQWIGAGRDSDSLLSPLCVHWLRHRGGVEAKKRDVEAETEVEVSDRSQTPPPPRCPTEWVVRRATGEEVREFREQERLRYDNPHKAFTYRCNGYESVVGPLKGIYSASVGNTKARGHTMLNADRPNFVTILSLVRDATARLPNGEGTRADICELLKSSQYISSSAPDNVLQSVVSGALDRMHTQFDPCVKYDQKRKIWIYLHRNRSQEDFERIHQQYQGVNKAKKVGKKTPTKPKPKVENKKVKSEDKKPTKPKIEKINSLLISSQEKTEKEISDTLHTIVQCASPPTPQRPSPVPNAPPKPKGLVKIISPSQGKSLIIPPPVAPVTKAIEQKVPPLKPSSGQSQGNVVAQQLLQTLQSKQKAKAKAVALAEEKVETSCRIIAEPKPPPFVQNIKNVTLVNAKIPEQIQIKTQGSALTLAQQQQILQTIKQKMLPQGGVQQSIVLKPGQKQPAPRPVTIDTTKAGIATTQSPVVAKVLTNAAGQVITVESLLAHQKQHGSLPQGTTLRVSGTKPSPNIIQLAPASKQNLATQFTMAAAQNNLLIANQQQPQPKLIVATTTATTTTVTTVTTAKQLPRVATTTKQQLLNAKLITSDGQKIFMAAQPKNISLANKPVNVNLGTGTNTIRMVNAANLNLTHIGGKPVFLAAGKGQNLILQSQGTPTAAAAATATVLPTTQTQHLINQQNIVQLPQLKVQQQQVVFGGTSVKGTPQSPGHLVLEGHQVRVTQAQNASQRVVLASQGQGGQIVAQQILLPAGFQGTAINIKALQGLKVIPLAQAHTQGRGVQGRQVFARVMSPTIVKPAPTADHNPNPSMTSSD